jgi:phosphate-induced protein 1
MTRSRFAVRSLVAGACAVLLVNACTDAGNVTAPSSEATPPSASHVQELNGRHLFHTKQFYAKSNSAKPSSSTGIFYHGGPLIVNPAVTKVVAIYWGAKTIYSGQQTGAGSGTSDGTLIGSFLRNLGGSPYFNINTTYYNGANAHVQNAVTYTGYWTTGTDVGAPSSSPTDADMVNVIATGISKGRIVYDANTVYAIFTGSGVNLGGGFGSQYCAYHTNGTVGGKVVLYAAMPHNQDYPSGCTSALASPNTDVAANSEVNTLAHEIEETTTDELGTAWYDRRGYENADKCAWTWGSTYPAPTGGTANMQLSDGNFYLIQQNWINSGSGGCTLG